MATFEVQVNRQQFAIVTVEARDEREAGLAALAEVGAADWQTFLDSEIVMCAKKIEA